MPFHIDFETRSAAELSDIGAYRYAEDDSTIIMLMAISKDDGPTHLWVHPLFRDVLPSDHRADELFDEMLDGEELIYAHNAQFERAMLMYRQEKDFGIFHRNIDQKRWRCTAAMARKAGLPDSLDMIGTELELTTLKDKRGKELIKLFSIPNKEGMFNEPSSFPAEFKQFGEYCCTDVDVEKGVQQKLKAFELKGISLKTFLFDVRLNDRGIPVNVEAAKTARRIVDEMLVDKVAEFRAFTGFNPTQRAKVKELIESYGWPMPDMKQPTLEATLEALEPLALAEPNKWSKCLQVVQGYAELNYGAAKKVHVILECVNKDGRVRGTLLYHGAGTGRWSGRLIQPQNFKKPSPHHKGLTDGIYKMICEGCSREELELMYGNPLDAIASSVRHFIQCNLDADFASVEARIVCWLAGQEDALEDYRKGVDQYKKMAADIYDRPVSTIENPSPERELGKQAVLGCGFQMAWKKFQATCLKWKIVISEELAKKAVNLYRERFYKVKELWYACDKAARNAIMAPGKVYTAGKLAFCVRQFAGIQFLCMTLPSGRVIAYPRPKVEITEGGDPERPSITFYGNIKGKIWGRCKIYGGLIVENATQGTAADFMTIGSCNAEDLGFEILTLIHDQGLGYGRPGKDLKEEVKIFAQALEKLEAWAVGCPIVAEAKPCLYYRK